MSDNINSMTAISFSWSILITAVLDLARTHSTVSITNILLIEYSFLILYQI